MRNKFILSAALLCCMAAFTACEKDAADPVDGIGMAVLPSEPGTVTFIPSIVGLDVPETKSILGGDAETKCSGYQILVFDRTDNVFVKAYSFPAMSITNTAAMRLNKSHTYDFYMVGNLWYLDPDGNRKSYDDLFTATGVCPQTPAEMKDPSKMPYYLLDGQALSVPGFRTETFAECADYGIPFSGVATGVTAASLDPQGRFDITVTRLFAKETVTVNHYGLDGGLGADIFKNGTLYLRQVNCRVHPFITGVGAQSADDILDVTDYYASMSNDQSSQFVLYVPENCQGTTAGSSAKIPENAPTGKSSLVTYVEFKGVVDKSAGGYGGNMLYQYCLGANASSDFNVTRNTNYSVSLEFDAGSLFNPYWKVSCTDNVDGKPVDTRKLGLCRDAAGSQMLAENNQPVLINKQDVSWFPFYIYFNKDGNSGLNQYQNHIDAYNASYRPGNVTRSAVDVQFPSIPGVSWNFDAATGKISFRVTDASLFTTGKTYDLTITLYAVSGVTVATYTAKVTTQADEFYITDMSVSPTEFTAAGGTTTITGGKVMKKVTDKFGNPLPDQDMGDATFTVSAHSSVPSVQGSVSGRTVTIPSLGKNVTAAGTYTLTASYGSLEKKITIKQGANAKTFFNPEMTLAYNPATIGAAGGTSSPTVTYKQKVSYTSGAEDNLTTGGTVTYSGSATGFTLGSDGKATAAANQGTERSISITAKVSMNGKEAQKIATVKQEADSIVGYSDPEITVSYSPETIGATGGTSTPTVTYKQTVTYASGRTEEVTTGGTVTYSGSATGFTLGSDGKVTAAANQGTERGIEVTAKVTVNGKTSEKKITVKQAGDSVSSYSDVTVNLSYSPTNLGAAGGTSTPTVTYSQTVYYTSGRQETVTSGGSVSYGGSATGFTVNSSNGTVTAAANQAATGRSVTVTASVSLNGKTGTKTATITQDADSIVGYSVPEVSVSYNPATIGAAGGTSTPTVTYKQTATYASGKTVDITSGGSVSYSGSATGFTVNSSNGTVTAAANESTSGRSVDVTASVTVNGKTGTKTATVNQSGDSVSSYSAITASLSYSPTNHSAAGGTSTPTLTYSQTATYVSGRTETITSGASVTYSGSATGFTVNSSNGAVTAAANQATSGRSVTVTANISLNGKSIQKTATITQDADSVASHGDLTVSFSYNPSTLEATGGTANPVLSYSQTDTYVSGRTVNVTSGATVTYSGSATGFTVNTTNGTVTAAANGNDPRSVTVTATVSLNGETASQTATVNQKADYEIIIE